MNIFQIVVGACILCVVISIIIISFPASFMKNSMKKELRKLQWIFFICAIVICFATIFINNLVDNPILVELKISLLCIPLLSYIAFSAFLYYPSTRLLVKINLEDQKQIDRLLSIMFDCAYGEQTERQNSMSNLHFFCENQKEFVTQFGLNIYLEEYQKHSTTITYRPSEDLMNFVLSRCNDVKYEIDHFTATPFPNIGLILSFACSTAITIIISIITIIQ